MGIKIFSLKQVSILTGIPYSRLWKWKRAGRFAPSFPGALPVGDGYSEEDILTVFILIKEYYDINIIKGIVASNPLYCTLAQAKLLIGNEADKLKPVLPRFPKNMCTRQYYFLVSEVQALAAEIEAKRKRRNRAIINNRINKDKWKRAYGGGRKK